MKSAVKKNFFREIRSSRGRFFSIMFIAALGVSFLSGIKAAEPDMRASLDNYYDRTKLFDVRVQGTLGLTDDDLKAIEAIPGAEHVEAVRTQDVLYDLNGSQNVLRFTSLYKDMNIVNVENGRLPEKKDECVIDAMYAERENIKIGTTLKVYLDNEDPDDKNTDSKHADGKDTVGKSKDTDSTGSDNTGSDNTGSDSTDITDINDVLAADTFTVTGIVSSPTCISFSRGSSMIGQGEVNAYVYVIPGALTGEEYTQIDIAVKGAEDETAYTDEYHDIVDKFKDEVSSIEDARCKARYDETAGDAQRKIDDAQKELDDNTKTIEENKKKLDDSQQEYDDGVKELEENRKSFEDGKKSAESQFGAAKDKLEQSQAELDANAQKLEQMKSSIDAMKSGAALQSKQGTDTAQTGQSTGSASEITAQLAQYEAQYEAGLSQLEAGRAQLTAGTSEYEAQKAATESKLAENQKKLDDAQKTLDDAKEKIADGRKELEDAEDKITDAKAEIADNQKKVDDIEYPEWYVTDRDDLPEYTQCGDNSKSIGAIGNVFPVIFFLVAALIALTTMTRMVEEERTQIGVLSALGYSKRTIIGKYIMYALLATSAGCVLGVLAGEKVFPFVIIYSYQIMNPYAKDIVIPYRLSYGLIASTAAVGCILAATLWACVNELTAVPAALMRPLSPTSGKRMILERIKPFWSKMSFSKKSTFRNLFRYKKRLFMTIFGIGGCMALMLVGFGIKDSISGIADLQYKDIQHYQGTIIYDDEKAGDDVRTYMKDQKDVSSGTIMFKSISAGSTSLKHDCYLYVPQDADSLGDFVTLRTRIGHTPISLSDNLTTSGHESDKNEKEDSGSNVSSKTADSATADGGAADSTTADSKTADGAITDSTTADGKTADGTITENTTTDGAVITEKLADMTGLKAGDTLTIVIDKKEYDVKVAAITENYLYHYVYMSRECYKDTFGEEPEDNAVVYKTSSTEENAYKAVGKKTLGIDGVLHVTYASATKSQLDNMLSALDAVIVVLVVAAGMLAFVVIYNLNNININERQRELATLKVLGFYNNEVAVYIYRENIWLTLAGCVAGCFLGKILHTFIIQTVEIDTCMFGRIIELRSYIYSTLFTVAFAVIVNLVMYFKLKQIDMIASLKSAE